MELNRRYSRNFDLKKMDTAHAAKMTTMATGHIQSSILDKTWDIAWYFQEMYPCIISPLSKGHSATQR